MSRERFRPLGQLGRSGPAPVIDGRDRDSLACLYARAQLLVGEILVIQTECIPCRARSAHRDDLQTQRAIVVSGDTPRRLDQALVQMRLVDHDRDVVPEQSGLQVACAARGSEPTQQQSRTPHLRRRADDLALSRVKPPVEIESHATTQARDAQRRGIEGGAVLDAAQRRQRRGHIDHDLVMVVRVGQRRAQLFGEALGVLELVIDERTARGDEHEAAWRPADPDARRLAFASDSLALGDEEHMDVHHRGLPRSRGHLDAHGPTTVPGQQLDESSLPPVRPVVIVDGREEAFEALRRSHRAPTSKGTSRPPPRWRARPSARKPPPTPPSVPRFTRAATATTNSPAQTRCT